MLPLLTKNPTNKWLIEEDVSWRSAVANPVQLFVIIVVVVVGTQTLLDNVD